MRSLVAATTILLIFSVSAPARASSPWLPVQGDIAGGVVFVDQEDDQGRVRTIAAPHASASLGVVTMMNGPPQSMFFGAGIEGTINSVEMPYQWSAGAGTRLGVAWKSPHRRSTIPDFYLHGRFTPFVGGGYGSSDEFTGQRSTFEKTGGGVRMAFGFTSPGWTRWVASGMGHGNDCGNCGDISAGSGEEALAICAIGSAVYITALLLNHAELVVETYGTEREDMDTRIGFRIGTGF